MKSILKFEAVKKALEQVVAESDVNNGTKGIELYCHYWQHEFQYDEVRQGLLNEMSRLVLAHKPDDVIKVRAQLEALGKAKINMEFKLMKPIPLIRGTKTVSDGDKVRTISATNVQTIFISEDSLLSDLAEFEETGDMALDQLGRETPVIKLKIKKGILDVKEAILDARDWRKPADQRRIVRGKRVNLCAVSYHALQVVGRMIAGEERARDKKYGYDEQS